MELRQYGVATTLYFPLIDKGATNLESTPVTIASGDCKISKDGGAFANTTTASFSHVAGGIYSIPLTATEMQAKQVVVKIVDQTGTKEWEDQVIIVTTMNHASAEIPTADPTATAVRSALGLATANLDTQLTAIDDYIDAEVSAIKAKTDNLPSDPADASDVAGAFATVNSTLSTIAAYVDTEVAAIKAKTDLIPAAPAAVGDIPTAAVIATTVLNRDISVNNEEDTATVFTLSSVILKLCSRFVAATGRTYKSDGTTPHMTQTPVTDPAADPITELGAGS